MEPATVVITNAGPDRVEVRVWDELLPSGSERDPFARLQLRPGNVRSISGRLIRVAIPDPPPPYPPHAPPFAAVEESWAVATDLADALARNGLPFHHAHKLVGRLVLESVRDSKKPSDWSAQSLAVFDAAFTPEMARYLAPAEGIRTRELPGGTGPNSVAQALKEAEARLAALP